MDDIIFNERELAIISESENRANEHLHTVESSVTQINHILYAVVIVLFAGLLTMIVGIAGIIWAARQTYTTSYNDYRALVETLNNQLQDKNSRETTAKIQKIQDQVNNFLNNNSALKK